MTWIIGFMLFFAYSASAKIGEWSSKMETVAGQTEYSTVQGGGLFNAKNVAEFVGKVLLIGPFLGILLIIHLVTAGYEWMTSAGDAKKVEDAKKRIKNAVIGVVLLIGMYVLATFIINSLTTVVNTDLN